jgi:hypothetical protein
MKLSLDFKDRLMLLSLFNTKDKAGLADWGIIDETVAVLRVSQEEQDLYGVEVKNDSTIWTNEKEAGKEKDYDIPKRGVEIAEEALKAMDKSGGILRDYVPLAKKLLE